MEYTIPLRKPESYKGYTPTLDRILIRSADETKTKAKSAGFILPDSIKNGNNVVEKGIVLATGSGGILHCDQCGSLLNMYPTTVKAGDTIFYRKMDFQIVTIDGEELYSIYSREVIAIVEE